MQQLCSQLRNTDHNITTDHFFTSVPLAEALLEKGLTLVGTLRQNKPDIPALMKASKSPEVHSTEFGFKENTTMKQLGETQTEIQQRIQERLKEIEEMKLAVETLKKSAQREMKKCEKIFTELIQSIEKIHTEVIELIGANEKAAVNQAEGRMKKLEQEIAELRRRNAELKQLSETEDHIHFLQNFQSLCAPPDAGDLPRVTVNRDISFGAVRKAVSELKDHIEDFCKGELVKITKTVLDDYDDDEDMGMFIG
ncbi:UNVERIFIED_CONTAM: hypothetical protein FKN15_035293 [Acipenser sinensis]